jgi:hypothetical protein
MKIYDSENVEGSLDYSISTFGYLDYQQNVRMQVLPTQGKQTGCTLEDYLTSGKLIPNSTLNLV